ncbi:hypothetical protein ACHAAC_15645 [Aeromicrobium sp. CF4.19]|uniref:A1S_2505 family phage non-structural protein n=1 Tax=Aeromicrobium sp. CF4.19 TaxID=3373082 RepID=UPI003EE61FAD
MTRTTPAKITELAEDEVFVFGSNASGAHGGGAALVAHRTFDAEWGVGEGLTGSTYALPTMEGPDAFRAAAERFVAVAREHPELTFLLTKVGCGIAGHAEDEVRPWFADTPPNVVKPAGW